MLWRRGLGGRKCIRPVKNWVVGYWRGYLSEARCRFAYGQLMPLLLTVSCSSKSRLVGRPYYRSSLWYTVSSVCLSVTFCIVAKRHVLAKNCLKDWIGNQGQKVDFLGSPPYFYFRFRLYGHQDDRFCLIFAGTAKQSVLDGRNLLSSSKPCAYCRIVWSELKPDSVLFVFIT